MSFITDLFSSGAETLVDSVGKVLDNVVTTREEKMQLDNETATAKTVTLPYTCKDMTGYYVGASVSIPAYSSKVLFKDIQPDPPSPAVYNRAWVTPTGKAIINSATGRPIIWK